MADRITYVGLDVHKESIVVAVASGGLRGRGAGIRPDREHGDGAGPFARKLGDAGMVLRFCLRGWTVRLWHSNGTCRPGDTSASWLPLADPEASG